MKYYIKIATIVCLLLFSVCMTGCEDKNESSKEPEQKKELSFKECFELIETTIKSESYKINIIQYETEYRASVEDNLGWFEVSNDKDATYIGWNDYVEEDGRVSNDEAYDILYYFNNEEGISETFTEHEARTARYSYVENLDQTEIEDYFACISQNDIGSMIQDGFSGSMSTMILPQYKSMISCIEKIIQNEEMIFVKNIVKNDKECVLSVALKDFLKWCDNEDTEYNISTEMSYQIDSYADDTILEFNFKIDNGNVKIFSMLLTSESSGMDKGFCWEIYKLDKSPKVEYETLIECIKPGNKDVAFKLFMQDMDNIYLKKSENLKLYYGKGIFDNNSVDGGFIRTLFVGENGVESYTFRYNQYDYDFESYEFPKNQEPLWTWDYTEFYTGKVWGKILDGEKIDEEEKIDDWKARLLSEMLEKLELVSLGNFIYLNDDNIPEIALWTEEGLYIYSYMDGDIVTYGPYACSDILYVHNKKMKICIYEITRFSWIDSEDSSYGVFDLNKDNNSSFEFKICIHAMTNVLGEKFVSYTRIEKGTSLLEPIYITEEEYNTFLSELERDYTKISIAEKTVWKIIYEMLENGSTLVSGSENLSETDENGVNEEEITSGNVDVEHQESRIIDFTDVLGKDISFVESMLSEEPYELECNAGCSTYWFGGITIEVDWAYEEVTSLLVEYEKFPEEYREIFTFSPNVNGDMTVEYAKDNWGEYLTTWNIDGNNISAFRREDENGRNYYLEIAYSDIGKIVSIKYYI